MDATAPTSSLISSLPSLFYPFHLSSNPLPSTQIPVSSPPSKLAFSPFNFSLSTSASSLFYPVLVRRIFETRATVEELAIGEGPTKNQNPNLGKKKLYVVNLPWTLPAATVRELFGECGSVIDIEMIKDKSGRNKGYAFVTMGTAEAAEAVMNKYNLTEMSGRTIRVEYAKTLKPKSLPPSTPPIPETHHKLYVSNLQWKVRTGHLREFFSAEFNPISAKVVFERNPGRSAGYGFISFATREEAEAAITSLNGKELLGRPIVLKFSETKITESGKEKGASDASKKNEQRNKDSQEAA